MRTILVTFKSYVNRKEIHTTTSLEMGGSSEGYYKTLCSSSWKDTFWEDKVSREVTFLEKVTEMYFQAKEEKINGKNAEDFPGGPVAENAPPRQGTGSDPWAGRSHMPWGN